MRIASGKTDQYIYFVAVDSSDYVTRETGLSGFTVYRSRDGAAASAMTSPTINEVDSTNMKGVYELLLDEDMTIDAENDTEEMVFHITKTGMAPVTRTIELYRPKITTGFTLGVNSSGHLSRVTLCDTTTTNTDMRGTDSAGTAANLATVDTVVDSIKAVTDNLPNSGSLSSLATAAALTTVDTVVDGIQTDLSNGTDGLGALKALIDTVDGVVDSIKAVTDNLPNSGSLSSLATAANLATVDTVVDGIKATTDALPDSGALSSLATASALATTDAVCDAIKAVTDTLSVSAISDGVWDEAIAGHAGAGTTGAALSAAGTSSDPWTTAIPGSYTAGQAGYVVGTTIVNGLSNDAIVYVNPSTKYDLELIRSDAYDGVSHDKLSFPAGKDIAGLTCTITVRNADTDASLMSVAGVGVGSNAVITLTSAQTASLVPGIQKFDVEVEHSGTSKQTVARGECIVLEDQTR